ncbi:acid-resistance membrane protein [Pseudovibrio sp. W64]|uniref:HdeD family acid-resistance protein n=1 Tax=unclassified Pseudovibrio TaxID=2627060 RepID=UPI00070C16E6|nr:MULTISPECIES: HdeD family acid-resistance protein [unclassified Pseudovibrio]KZK77629.1 acid-resistance membrane protein [Pseudovibrio sp. Ad46]KZK83835.1 acid-resistance membrane protein [Pseudovibrio sp. W64]KZK93500.1 acid-resistance membrane protein [Pseudovibrio sp. Ad5]
MSGQEPNAGGTPPPNVPDLTQLVRDNWLKFLVLGVLMVIGGTIVLVIPYASSIAVALVIGLVLIVVGVLQLWHAMQVKEWGGFLGQSLVGIIALVGGVAIYYNPVAGTEALTLVLSAVFIAQGIAQALFSFRLRPHTSWGWILASGVIAIAAGLMILLDFPASTGWALGLVAGISIMFNGWSYVAIALAAHKKA